MTVIEAWGLKLQPGKPEKFTLIPEDEPSALLRITNASLTENIQDPEGRTLVKITKTPSMMVDDVLEDLEDGKEKEKEKEKEDDTKLEEFILCSLIPGKIEQVLLHIEFGTELVQFELIGKNEVHLFGNIIDQDIDQGSPSDFDSDLDSDEDAYKLQDVSSDVEVQEAKFDFEDSDDDSDDSSDADRFEEVVEGADKDKPASKKGGLKRGADAMDEDAPEAGANGAALSKTQKKKLAKKLKNAAGEGVASTAGATDDEKDKKKDGKKDDKPAVTTGTTRTLPSGIEITDTKVGTGKPAKKGKTLSMRYIGKLTNKDGKVFDKNIKGSPFSFRLGAGEVIKGWDEGLVGMQVGGERVLTIPANMAYGKKGSGKDIPPNSVLRFEVKLLDIKGQ